MEEIKFRAWNKKDGKMISSAFSRDIHNAEMLCLCIDGRIIVVSDGGQWVRHDDNFILMQYTGLRDKNGRKIYEDDILLVPDQYVDTILEDGTGPMESFYHHAVVKFVPGAFGVVIPKSGLDFQCGFNSFNSMFYKIGDLTANLEKVGNVYENPELLEISN